jgi:exonuclease SbcC
MIPVSLYIKNFLSYGEDVPLLDFTEFDVACLSGNNGHGKSAILDAMTWALWGEARKAIGEKSPADGLLRIGTTEMQVELVFDLEGDRYRVLRKYQRRKNRRGISLLEFQVFDEVSQGYKSLSERTIRATQDKINGTLRMNYETFINSAFILQGRVDEFTKRNPSQRKAILADILDLSRYESLRELARGHYRQAKSQDEILEAQLHVMDKELKHKGEYEQALHELERKLTQLDKTLTQHNTKRQTLEKQQVELQGKQQQLTDKKQRQTQLREECKRLDTRITQREKEIEEVSAILQQERDILRQYKQYLSLQTKNSTYEEKFRQTLTYQEQQRLLEQAIQNARHDHEKELEKWQTKRSQTQKDLEEMQQFLTRTQEIESGFEELQICREQDECWEEKRNRVEKIERSLRTIEKENAQKKNHLDVELQSLERHIAELQTCADLQRDRERQLKHHKDAVVRLESLEQERDQNKEKGTQCRTHLENLEERKKRLQQTIQEIEEKVEILKRSDKPQCPLCESYLDNRKKQDIEDHFRQEILAIKHEEQQLEREIQKQNDRLQELRAQYKRFEKQIKKLQPSREQYIQTENALRESQKAAEQLQELRAKAVTLRIRILNDEYDLEERRQFINRQKEKEKIGYDPKEHQHLKQQLKSLRKFEGEYSKLEDVRERQRKSSAQLPDIEQEINRIRSLLDRQDYADTERLQLQEVLSQIRDIGYDEQAHAQIQQDLQRLQDAPAQKVQLDQASKSIGSLRQTIDELVSERQQKAMSIAEFNRQIVELEQELEKLPTVDSDLKEITTGLQSLQQERDELLQTRGTYQNKYERCKQLETEFVLQQEKKNQMEKDCTIYEHLVKIFGKDGIQAYLIENAIPEIEDEANAILSRLTDNRTYIAIESVKDLQSGRTKETLDIKISDELGTRSYEMYSGGEAFRVDFAIRVALSKLLANRAGTKLRTLVIDEGFGTQDVRGLEQLVEAIKTISVDFEKILVITHLESLKDAFPVRIEVVKLPDLGSRYQIVR